MNCNKLVSVISILFLSLSCFAITNRLVLPLQNSDGRWGFCYEDGTIVIPFSFERVYYDSKNRMFDVFSANGSETYIDAYGNMARKKEELPSYTHPVVENVKSNGCFVLIHKDGRTKAFSNVLRMRVYDDGCATCVTKDGRGGFSNNPLKGDSWIYFTASTRSLVFYDSSDKVISYSMVATNNFGGWAWRYLNLDGSKAEPLETAARKYDYSSFSMYGWIPVLKVIDGVCRIGVLSRSGDELIACNYDSLDAVSDYICCWKNDKTSMKSLVTCFDGNGSRMFAFQVDKDADIDDSFTAIRYWCPVQINGRFCWVNVNNKKKIEFEKGKVVVSQINEYE